MTKEQKQFNEYCLEIKALLEENERKIALMEYPVCEQCGKSFNPNGEENLEVCFECE